MFYHMIFLFFIPSFITPLSFPYSSNSNYPFFRTLQCEDSSFMFNFTNKECEPILECNIKNCKKCSSSNKCVHCKNSFILENNNCYSTNCEIFGFCKYCDQYECMKCQKGHELQYGLCPDSGGMPIQFYYILVFAIVMFIFVMLLCQCKKIIVNQNSINDTVNSKRIIIKEIKKEKYGCCDNTNEKESECISNENTTSSIGCDNENEGDGGNEQCGYCDKKVVCLGLECGCGTCLSNDNNVQLKCSVHKYENIKKGVVEKSNDEEIIYV